MHSYNPIQEVDFAIRESLLPKSGGPPLPASSHLNFSKQCKKYVTEYYRTYTLWRKLCTGNSLAGTHSRPSDTAPTRTQCV